MTLSVFSVKVAWKENSVQSRGSTSESPGHMYKRLVAADGWFGGILLTVATPSDSKHAGQRISPNGRSLASAVEEVDVRFVHNANRLHGFPQVGRLGECLRTVEIFCLKQQDDFIRLLRSPKKLLLRKSCFNAFWEVSVVSALPLREVPDFVPDKHVAGHKSLLTIYRTTISLLTPIL